ncbi:MAG: tRNA pseudouridine(38-40) synthase TruA [Bacilli bacterium]
MNRLVYASFNGHYFQGTQIQESGLTVQSLLEEKLSEIYDEKIRIHPASRLDKGVSAYSWAFNFLTESNNVPTHNVKYVLNRILPEYIHIVSCEEVKPDFDARYHAKEKTYVYRINMGEANPIDDEFAWCPVFKGKVHRIREVCDCFVGEHDFTSFCSPLEKGQDCHRIVDMANVTFDGRYLEIRITAKSFMRHQIRFMVGAAYQASIGNLKIEEIIEALEGTKQLVHKYKVPAKALILESTKYIEEV